MLGHVYCIIAVTAATPMPMPCRHMHTHARICIFAYADVHRMHTNSAILRSAVRTLLVLHGPRILSIVAHSADCRGRLCMLVHRVVLITPPVLSRSLNP
jgi:hypothetical protein